MSNDNIAFIVAFAKKFFPYFVAFLAGYLVNILVLAHYGLSTANLLGYKLPLLLMSICGWTAVKLKKSLTPYLWVDPTEFDSDRLDLEKVPPDERPRRLEQFKLMYFFLNITFGTWAWFFGYIGVMYTSYAITHS